MSPAGGGGSASAIFANTVTGWHVLNIECYSVTKGLGVGKFIKSSAFNVGGHSWHIKYYPDGYNQDYKDYISFRLCANIYQGVEVRARFKFIHLEPDGMTDSKFNCDEEYHHLVQTFKNSQSWGDNSFFDRDIFEDETDLKDDCFSVRCEVTVFKDVRAKATEQFSTVPPSTLHQDLGWLLSSGEGADVTFEVNDELFKAHRNVFASRSSVFRAQFFSPMKEKMMRRVVISDMEPRVFKALLHFVYTDSLPAIVKEEETVIAQHLVVAADTCDLKRLKLICEDKLCYNIDRSTVTTSLVLAEQYRCQGLKEACVTFLMSPGILKEVMGTDEYDHLKKSCPSLVDDLVAELAPKRIRLN